MRGRGQARLSYRIEESVWHLVATKQEAAVTPPRKDVWGWIYRLYTMLVVDSSVYT
jgi:hypothetical protein